MSKQAVVKNQPSCAPIWVPVDTLDFFLTQDPDRESKEVQELIREDYFHLGRAPCPSDEWAEVCF